MRPSSPRSIESSSKFSSANYDLTREQEIVVKQRIKDILYSVKEEKQHIENIMFQNEANIKRFTAEYEAMVRQL